MIAPFMYPVTLIKVDEENKIVRDRNGVCVKAKPGNIHPEILKKQTLFYFSSSILACNVEGWLNG